MTKKISEKLEKISDRIDMKLRNICFKMSYTTRAIIIAVMFFLFAFGSFFILVTAVYQVGKEKGKEEMMIKHITVPEILINPNYQLRTKTNE